MPSKFDVWMDEVSRVISKIAGVEAMDLSDCDYRTWYDDGCTPEEAARMALEESGFPG